MSDEDSFVILGSSPMPSINADLDVIETGKSDGSGIFSSLQCSQISNKVATPSITNNLIEAASSVVAINSNSDSNSSAASNDITESTNRNSNPTVDIVIDNICVNESIGSNVKQNSTSNKNSIESNASVMSNSAPNGCAGSPLIGKEPTSLASSFLLGEINADVLKTSVYSQFPSICSMESCAEDVVKLQTFMTEHLELKHTLFKFNNTMCQHYYQTKQWKENMHRVESQYKQQIDDCQLQIAGLRNQNIELKRDLDSQTEQIRIINEVHQKDNNELIQSISEKTAQITNMRTIIEKLEQQQLTSFEYIPKKSTITVDEPEYVAQLEHQRIIKELERRITILEHENKELHDMTPQYIDEINCLKVNLTAAEELINKFRADVNLLKAKDIEKSEIFENYELERNQMREELTLLRQQVEIYSKDFEMERNSRQQLASEKDDLLQDLRALQRRNQQLIEEAENHLKRYTEHAGNSASATKATSTTKIEAAGASNTIRAQTPNYNDPQRPIRNLTPPDAGSHDPKGMGCCPICSKKFPNLNELQSHASNCINFQNN